MNEIKTMIEDDREILSVFEAGCEDYGEWNVGSAGITKITLYSEAGPHCLLCFAAIWKGDVIAVRLPMACLGISYKA